MARHPRRCAGWRLLGLCLRGSSLTRDADVSGARERRQSPRERRRPESSRRPRDGHPAHPSWRSPRSHSRRGRARRRSRRFRRPVALTRDTPEPLLLVATTSGLRHFRLLVRLTGAEAVGRLSERPGFPSWSRRTERPDRCLDVSGAVVCPRPFTGAGGCPSSAHELRSGGHIGPRFAGSALASAGYGVRLTIQRPESMSLPAA
jgi:hypothetical protein